MDPVKYAFGGDNGGNRDFRASAADEIHCPPMQRRLAATSARALSGPRMPMSATAAATTAATAAAATTAATAAAAVASAAAAAAVASAAAAAAAAVATAAAAAAVLASSSASSCSAEPLNQRIHVNPSRLRGLPERLSSFEGFAELGATEADAHDDDWVARIASSIRGVQFGVLELPQPYAQVYQLLIDPSSYPPAVCAPGRKRGDPLIPITALPPRLVSLSAIWAAVCECICAAVTRELEARTRDTPLFHTTGGHGERRHGSTVNKPCAQRPVCFPAALEAHSKHTRSTPEAHRPAESHSLGPRRGPQWTPKRGAYQKLPIAMSF